MTMNVGSGVGVTLVLTPGGVVAPLAPTKFAIAVVLSLNVAFNPTSLIKVAPGEPNVSNSALAYVGPPRSVFEAISTHVTAESVLTAPPTRCNAAVDRAFCSTLNELP